MVFTSWWLRDSIIILPIVVGAIAYLSSIIILRVVPKEDWQFIKSFVHSAIHQIQKTKSIPSEVGGEL
jgi:hypothetical protein